MTHRTSRAAASGPRAATDASGQADAARPPRPATSTQRDSWPTRRLPALLTVLLLTTSVGASSSSPGPAPEVRPAQAEPVARRDTVARDPHAWLLLLAGRLQLIAAGDADAGGPMATRTTYTLHDDLDGSPADETVPFGLDGTAYTIDLSAAHAADLRTALAPFVQAANLAAQRQARRVEQGSARRRSPSRPTRSADSPARRPNRAAQHQTVNTAIRVWARSAGYEVRDRGRLNKTIVEAYHRATAGQDCS